MGEFMPDDFSGKKNCTFAKKHQSRPATPIPAAHQAFKE